MNNIDTIVLVVIMAFALIGLKRGFIKTCFSFVPGIFSLFAAGKMYPYVSRFLRGTPIYKWITKSVGKALNLEGNASDINSSEIIKNLSLPDFFKESLMENNNSAVYEILDVSGINEYISEFMANIFLNIFSFIFIALLITILFKILFVMLDVISKLPVIHGINSFAGIVVGAMEGVVLLWVVFVVTVFFVSGQKLDVFYTSLESSVIAMPLFKYNIILKTILRIIA